MTIEQLIAAGRAVVAAMKETTTDKQATALHRSFVQAYLKCTYSDGSAELKAAIMLAEVSRAFMEHCSWMAVLYSMTNTPGQTAAYA